MSHDDIRYKQKHESDSEKIINFLVDNGHIKEAEDYRNLSNHLFQKNATGCLNVHHMNINFFIKQIQSLQSEVLRLNNKMEQTKEYSKLASNKEVSQARQIELLTHEIDRLTETNRDLNLSLYSYEKRYNSITTDLAENYNTRLEALKQFHSYLDTKKSA